MNAHSQFPRREPEAPAGSYIPLIFVRSIYSPEERERIRDRLLNLMAAFDIGVPRLHTEIMNTVAANNKRIRKPDGKFGLNPDAVSHKNVYHFFEGRRSDDFRIQVMDAFIQLYDEDPPATHLMV